MPFFPSGRMTWFSRSVSHGFWYMVLVSIVVQGFSCCMVLFRSLVWCCLGKRKEDHIFWVFDSSGDDLGYAMCAWWWSLLIYCCGC